MKRAITGNTHYTLISVLYQKISISDFLAMLNLNQLVVATNKKTILDRLDKLTLIVYCTIIKFLRKLINQLVFFGFFNSNKILVFQYSKVNCFTTNRQRF